MRRHTFSRRYEIMKPSQWGQNGVGGGGSQKIMAKKNKSNVLVHTKAYMFVCHSPVLGIDREFRAGQIDRKHFKHFKTGRSNCGQNKEMKKIEKDFHISFNFTAETLVIDLGVLRNAKGNPWHWRLIGKLVSFFNLLLQNGRAEEVETSSDFSLAAGFSILKWIVWKLCLTGSFTSHVHSFGDHPFSVTASVASS